MARSKSTGRSADAIADANVLSTLLRPVRPTPVLTPSPYLVNQDERFYSPVRLLSPRGPGGAPARIREARTPVASRARLQFVSPAAVDICRKRKDRREVMFALRKSGKGSQSRFRKLREFSRVKCK